MGTEHDIGGKLKKKKKRKPEKHRVLEAGVTLSEEKGAEKKEPFELKVAEFHLFTVFIYYIRHRLLFDLLLGSLRFLKLSM